MNDTNVNHCGRALLALFWFAASGRITESQTMTKPISALSTSVVDERGAATLLGIAPATLRNIRSQGRGPTYCRVGRRVVYRVRDVDAYLENNAVDPEANR